MCQDLWDTHTLGEKRSISRLVAFLHWLSDIALKKHRGYTVTVLSVAIYSSAKSCCCCCSSFPCGRLPADMYGDFSHSDILSSPSIFQFKKQIGNVVENMCSNMISHDVWHNFSSETLS